MLRSMVSLIVFTAALMGMIVLGGCSTTPSAPPPSESGNATSSAVPPMTAKSVYRLGQGDQIRIIVFDEPTLSGDFRVDDAGYVSLPLIGGVKATGLTLRELEDSITARLKDGYIRDPRVSAEVANFRPFYIYGEVAKGGEYPYVAGMHVLKAIALAGGYTYRANKKKVLITRSGSNETLKLPATDQTLVLPGDVIRVPEKYF